MPHAKKPVTGAPLLAQKIKDAMDKHEPKITLTAAASKCGVSVQAVHGWRTNGRISKPKLLILAGMTGKSPDYFMSDESLPKNGAGTHQTGFETLQRAWDTASQDQKDILISVATGILNAHRGKRAGKS